jgi:outer membrane protein TolC
VNLVSKVDVLQIKVDYHTSQIDLKKEQQVRDVALLKLKQLIGNDTFDLPLINVKKHIIDTIDSMQMYVDNINENLESNLGVKEALISSQLTMQEIDSAYAGHLPKVNLNASYSRYDTDTPTIDFSYDSVAKVMLTLDIPLYSGGYVSSQVKSSKLMNQASEEDVIDANKRAVLERDQALNKFRAAVQTINMFQETFEAAELYYDAVKQSFDHGLKSRVDLNDANNKLYKIKYQYIENISEIVDSYISLLIVTNNFEGIKLLDNLIL